MAVHTERITVKMPQPMYAYITRKAKRTYRNNAEYIRQLIVDDMKRDRANGYRAPILPTRS